MPLRHVATHIFLRDQIMQEKDKFKNIPAINAHIRTLYRLINAPLAPNFRSNLVIDSSQFNNDPVICAQNIAKQIACHFGLKLALVVVTFVHNLGAPGKVELSAGSSFHIDIDAKYKSNTNFLAAILAHEIAHIYLFRHNISINGALENEILTDTVASFLGCAGVILNSSYDEVSYENNRTTVHSFGYITHYEVGYILAKRDFLLRQDSSEAMIYGRSKEFFTAGKTYFFQTLGRPYRKRSRTEKLVYWLKSRFKAGSIIFQCICCEQQLSIPANNKLLSVHCASCDNTLLCYS